MIKNEIETYGFMFLETKETQLIGLEGIGIESRYENYHFYNQNRMNQSYLFQYTLEGRGSVCIEEKTFSLEKQEGFFLKLPSDSSYGVFPNEQKWKFIWIMMSGILAEHIYQNICINNGNILHIREDSAAIVFLKKIFYLAQNNQIQSNYRTQEMVFSFLCRLLDDIDKRELLKYSMLTVKSKEIIADHYADLQGIGDLALRLGVSQEHLSRIFHKETGEQIINYLTKVRIYHAVEMLRENHFRMEEIAFKCGFSSGNYFGKVFKRYFGISPKKYQVDPVYRDYSNITSLE